MSEDDFFAVLPFALTMIALVLAMDIMLEPPSDED
jgi:hypothetical protein